MTTNIALPATDQPPSPAARPALRATVRDDDRSPDTRLARLLDPRGFAPLHAPDRSGVRAVRGLIDGVPVVAYCTDATVMGGALGSDAARHICGAIDLAVRQQCPVIGVWHSGGARLADGVDSLDGMGRMFAAMTRASGQVPQVSVVLGPAAGAAAYGPALTDLVVMAEAGRMFVTGPEIVRSVTGEQADMETLGGLDAHGRRSGVVHLPRDSEASAFAGARRLVTLLAAPGRFDPDAAEDQPALHGLLPERRARAYDMRPVVRTLLDRDHAEPFVELQAKWAPNVLTGFGRLTGGTVGVLANNPLRKGGCLDTVSAEKAARFVRMCDALGVPLLVLVDVPGYLPGLDQEWTGVIRRGAKLLHAFAEAVVPRVTLVVRKAYGGAYIAMNSRALGATAVFAWPGAEVAVMGAEAAVGLLHRKQLAAEPPETLEKLRAELVEEHRRVAGGVERAVELGLVDDVIDPAETRRRLAAAFAAAPSVHGIHGNIPL